MKTTIHKILLYTVSVILSVIFLVPLYYTIINSINPLFAMPAVLLPRGFEFINYYYAVTLIPFWQYFKNSVIILAIALSLSVSVNFMYGYAFARLKAPGRSALFNLTLSQMMIPAFAMQIPQYIIFSKLGMKDTFWIWVLNGLAGTPFIIFLYRQYILGISKEIEEAAIIDGVNYFSIIPHIFVPLCKPVIAVAFFYEFVAHWGDYMTPYMYLTSKNYPLSIALFGINYVLPSNPGVSLRPVVCAAAILLMLPVMAVFFFCQKQLVSGVTAGSVKG